MAEFKPGQIWDYQGVGHRFSEYAKAYWTSEEEYLFFEYVKGPARGMISFILSQDAAALKSFKLIEDAP